MRSLVFLISICFSAGLCSQSLPDQTFTGYFRRSGPGWNAGDATISVALPDNRIIWLFGDSYLNQPTDQLPCLFQIRNSMMVQDLAQPDQMVTRIDENASGVFRTTFKYGSDNQVNHFLWPGHGFFHNDTVYLFLHRWYDANPADETLEPAGTMLARLSFPALDLLSIDSVPLPPEWLWGKALIPDPASGWLYVYNNRYETGFVNGYRAYLSRTSLNPLFQLWEFRTAIGWSADIHNSVPIAGSVVSPTYSAFTLDGKYYLLSQQIFGNTCGNGREIYLSEAAQPWGPFNLRRWLYTVEDQFNGSYLATYNAYAHPALIQNDQLLVSYNVNDPPDPDNCPAQCANGGTTRHADTYRPKFIRVPLADIRLSALFQQARLFLLAGQSNAVGQGDAQLSPMPGPGTAFQLNLLQQILYPLKDPTGFNDAFFSFQQANTGSLAPAFAVAYHQECGRVPILVHTAVSGSACHPAANPSSNWSASGTLFNRCKVRTDAAVNLTGLPLSGVIWSQGETDAGSIRSGAITVADYEAALADLVSRFRQQYGQALPFFIVQTGRNFAFPDDNGYAEVRQVQGTLAVSDDDTWLVFDSTRFFLDLGLMKPDLIHYNQEGLNLIGQSIGTKICRILTDADTDGYNALIDCDDSDAGIFPGAMELCDGLDNNCNGMGDEPPDCAGPCMGDMLTLNDDPLLSNVYRAESVIFSAGVIPAAATVHFRVGQRVVLQPGFRAAAGSLFSAKVWPCAPALMRGQEDGHALTEITTQWKITGPEEEQPGLRCYPNPFRHFLNIAVWVEEPGPLWLSIYDGAGRRVSFWQTAVHTAPAEFGFPWVPDEAGETGLFFVVLYSKGRQWVEKVLRIRGN